ncbi:hypothetical protein B0H10DRAFT_553288 [Mycena sp. CBHHK59/15]|nr:hypothetical protein B0H10DRAFT_553288 [Mycena sp. CBHHK59/15]
MQHLPRDVNIADPSEAQDNVKRKLCIEKWVKTLATSESSGHTPWGGVENVEAISWISEGSIYPPDAFKASLAIARRHRTLPPPSISVTAPPNVFHRSANRNALVFEHEIILNSGGNSRRLSLRVPAKTMNPEVVDMMLELQSLNSFFKEGSEEMDQPAAPQPPSLVVSNSHFALPVSLESSGNLSPGIPLALAARRGKKMLPPLSFKQSVHEEDAYPSMPTAFLGSPSSYSPKFEFASDPNRSSMDLQQMVTSLRSQCASIDSTTPLDANLEELALSTAAGKEEDEWAFADGLLDLYTSRPFDPDFVKKPLLPQLVDYAEESLAHAALSSNNQRPRSDLSPPPSTPLPPCPPPQRLSVRSILKSSKSVRFASLPNERPVSIPTPAVIAPRRSLGSLSPPRKQPLLSGRDPTPCVPQSLPPSISSRQACAYAPPVSRSKESDRSRSTWLHVVTGYATYSLRHDHGQPSKQSGFCQRTPVSHSCVLGWYHREGE